jgi:hypothetical protein
MKNTLELQLRALRPPRVLKKTEAGIPEFTDIWAIHHSDRSSSQWAIAVKFGREIAGEATAIKTGTLFTVKGRLDQSKDPKTGAYHTFIWAEQISELVPSRKTQPEPPGSEAPPSQEEEAPDFFGAVQDDENPKPEPTDA